jgi:hypothetical protein
MTVKELIKILQEYEVRNSDAIVIIQDEGVGPADIYENQIYITINNERIIIDLSYREDR